MRRAIVLVVARYVGSPLLAFAGLATAAPLAADHLLVNETPSVPAGLYVRRPGVAPAIGRLVAVRQPVAAKTYLASLSVPTSMLLFKRVVAAGGDIACGGRDGLWARDRMAPALQRDRRGASLTVWPGCRVLADDEYIVLGDTATSYDSRYFGPVRRADIQGVYREIIRW